MYRFYHITDCISLMDMLSIAKNLFVAALIVVTSVIRHHHHDCEGHAVIGENSVECLINSMNHSSHHSSHTCDTRCSMHIGAHMTKRIASSTDYDNNKTIDSHDFICYDEVLSEPSRTYKTPDIEIAKSLITRYMCATGGFRAPPLC